MHPETPGTDGTRAGNRIEGTETGFPVGNTLENGHSTPTARCMYGASMQTSYLKVQEGQEREKVSGGLGGLP